MTYESVTLASGEQITLEVKEGHHVIPEDIRYLEEYVRIMGSQPEPGVQGFPVGGRHRKALK